MLPTAVPSVIFAGQPPDATPGRCIVSRHTVVLRPARVEDALFLALLWSDALRRGDRQEQVADVELVVKDSLVSAEQRLLVAEVDGLFSKIET